MGKTRYLSQMIKKQWKLLVAITPVIILLSIIAIDVIFMPFHIPFASERTFKEYHSSDGKMIARFTWKPVGLLGTILALLADDDSNPMVYITVIRSMTGEVVIRESSWEDVPEDSVKRLWCHVPWTLDYSSPLDQSWKKGEFIAPQKKRT
jgi:hypothetical protein